MTTTWNPSDATANWVFSNTNHTATGSAGAGNEGVRGTSSHTTGKYYLEYSAITMSGASGCVGFARPTDTLGANSGLCVDAGGYLHCGANTYAINAGVPAGHVVQLAVDLNNGLIWEAYDGGIWNNNAANNPATGVGGVSYVGGGGLGTAGSIILLPYLYEQFSGGHATINAGDNAFVYSIPAGFLAWDGNPPVQTRGFGRVIF